MSENVKKKESKNKRYIEESEDDDEEKNYAIIPPNGGWGWMVVACAFYCNVIVDGIQLTFGVFLEQISESLQVHHSNVALASSLMFGIHLLMGPLCASFSNEFGLRPVTIAGAIVCCFGVGLSYFSTGYLFLYFSYGVMGGIGLGLIYMNTLIITGVYFTTRIPLAVGIVVCGTGVGTMIFAAFGYYLLRATNWQTSFLIQAALAGSMAIAAIAFKPLKPIRVEIISNESLPTTSKRKTTVYSDSKDQSTAVFIKRQIPKPSVTSIRSLQSLVWDGYLDDAVVRNLKRQPFCHQFHKFCKCCKRCRKKPKENKVLILKEITQSQGRKSYIEKQEDGNDDKNDKEEEEVFSVKGSESSLHTVYQRIDYNKRQHFCSQWRRTLFVMLDCRLLKSAAFCLFSMSGALQMASLLIVYVYEIDRCQVLGFSQEMSVYFVICLGGANTAWRLFLGGIASIPKVNYTAVAVSGILIGGLATMFSGLSHNIYYQFGFCVLFGLGMASFAVFRLILLLELVDTKKIENATGINLLFMGITCIIFPPLFGWIMEVTNSYNVVFFTTGFILCASGTLLLPLKKVQEREFKKKQRAK